MKKTWFLSTCSTCTKIIKQLNIDNSFVRQDIKTENISVEELDRLKNILGSYEALFSRKARKYKELGLAEKELGETDIRELILSDYTFLKRPVFLIGEKAFAGNSAKTIEEVNIALNS
jgi:arsenate reductase (glutaredoxin)